jgi:hypothetical protein
VNRRLLVSLMAFGAVITLVGAAGIFAVFTDRATTGSSSVTSGESPSAADLKISRFTGGVCELPADDLTANLFSISNAQPTAGSLAQESICLANVGSASLDISATVIDLLDTETGCTGDEAAAGDTTCGPGATLGELSSVLVVVIAQVTCDNTEQVIPGSGVSGTLSALSSGPGTIGGAPVGVGLLPGESKCLRLQINYPTDTSETAAQIAQTDQATWRFAFDGTATVVPPTTYECAITWTQITVFTVQVDWSVTVTNSDGTVFDVRVWSLDASREVAPDATDSVSGSTVFFNGGIATQFHVGAFEDDGEALYCQATR